MNKRELIGMELPQKYRDCSSWFKEGLDNSPTLLDFISAGKNKSDYDKFSKLSSIEHMRLIASEASGLEIAQVQECIDEAIKQYNEM